MKFKFFLKLPVFLAIIATLASNFAYAQLWQGKGRIAVSSDGNDHDSDDWAATAVTLAIIANRGLQNKLVHYDYANHVWVNKPLFENNVKESALGTGQRFGFDLSKFHNSYRNQNAAIQSIKNAVNASSADNPLFFILAGPMEVAYQGIKAANPAKRKFVTCISHSTWNDWHGECNPQRPWTDCHPGSHQKQHIQALGVKWVQISDQNAVKQGNKVIKYKFHTNSMAAWSFLNRLNGKYDKAYEFTYQRVDAAYTTGDASDAGMAYYLFTGDQEGDATKLENLMRSPAQGPGPGPSTAITVPGRVQAENYTTHQGVQKENTSDAGGGQNIGYINNGDFTQYKIKAQSAGSYKLNFRVASASAGGKITIKSNGNKVGEINITNTTDWQAWASKSVNVTLPAGEQTLRLEFSGTPFFLFNINYVDFSKNTSSPSGTSKTLSPTQDAYLQGSTKIDNDLIRIENGKRTGYLMYDLSGINGTITSAKLVFKVAGDAGSGNLNVHKGSSNNWNENNLSNNNKPATGALLGSLNNSYNVGSTQTVNLNVSGISGNQLSLILMATSGNDFALAANEHASVAPAQLVITYTPNARVTRTSLPLETKPMAYPNPVQDRLFIKGATGIGFIYNLQGQRFTKVNISKDHRSIDVSSLKPGQYTLVLDHKHFFNFIKK